MNFIPSYKNSFRILKGGKISLVVSSFLASTTLTFAAPSGGVVTSGSANISQNGKVTDITQSTQKASINWNKFNIASDETVNFKQPNSSSITLNRVVGNEKSIINGALNANGQVWIINSNGVLFGKGASINTSGLLATTKDISDADFQAGNYKFTGNSNESVINLGTIDVVNGGSVILAANEVKNEGSIKAIRGKIHLAGADEYTVNLNGNSLVNLIVNKGVLDALVKNSGTIIANGGEIYLTTNAVNELLKGVVNNTGVIEANSLAGITGHVELFAHGGTANIDGSIIAKGGFVETSGEKLNVTSNTKVIAKDWLLDPTNILIESTGGSVLTGDSVSATAIQNNLETTNVHLQATNNITVNQNITWSTDKQLKLQADNINVNATINNTNQTNGGVAFQAANTTNKVVFGTNGKVIVNNVYQMQWMNQALNGKYELGSNINAGVTKTDTANWGTTGFNPIGDYSNRFNGTFDGLGFTISNLYINRPSQNYVGLFGYTNSSAVIKNIGLKDVNITGKDYTGALVGENGGTISNSYASGSVNGGYSIGGLVGYNYFGTISNSYSSGTVNGDIYIGGLVGDNYYGTISNSYTTGNVTGQSFLGGLVGNNENGTISNSYASGNVNGTGTNSFDGNVGGLLGYNYRGTITNSYASGNVNGNENVGGLLGSNDGTISNSYASGDVNGTDRAIGGLVGLNADGTISNSYATGSVKGTKSDVGGLVGWNLGTISNSFFDKDTTKQTQGVGSDSSAEGVSGKTTAQMKDKGTFEGWDIEGDNKIDPSTPFLAWENSEKGYTKKWVIGTKVIKPDPDPKPDPVDPKPDPVDPKPDPVDPKPDPVDPKPDPVDPKPDPVDPKPDPVDPKPDPKPEIKKIVDSITNESAITINLPNVEANTTPNNIGKNVNIIFVQGENQMLVSRPIEGQSTQRVSLSEARQMQIQNGGSSEEVIVPLSNSSIIQLIDGGVNLPSGVEQEFYLADVKEEK